MGITTTEASDTEWLPFLLQTSDALFPTGAYAHSLGFEEVVRLGVVRDEATLGTFLEQQIIPAQREQELPYLRFAHDAAAAEDLAQLTALDREISAWKLAAETRDASAQLGGRRLKALQTISSSKLLEEFAGAIKRGEARGHHLVVCGLQAAVEKVPLRVALITYAYQALAAICSAALKLIRIGQDGIQRVLRMAAGQACAEAEASLAVERKNAGWFNPMLEIASMRHARADERLFIS
jgi:urease accessory protein